MNASQLKKWKDRQVEDAENLVAAIPNPSPDKIKAIYPEFKLGGVYTTSLDPYTPLWALLPFFDKVIVGITPYLRTENQFSQWYGVSPKQLMTLRENDKVVVRVLFPKATNTVPSFLNHFFTDEFPSTIRDRVFDDHLLGNGRFKDLTRRFTNCLSGFNLDQSIDSFRGNQKRALRTAEAAYLQLHALGYSNRADEFETLYKSSPTSAFSWLELCRLFLVGPIHYSLLGSHLVSSDVGVLQNPHRNVLRFPSELGRILVETLQLVKVVDEPGDFTIDDCIQMYPDYEEARTTLFALDNALKQGIEKDVVSTSDELKRLIKGGYSRRENWLHFFKIIASTGVGAAALPLNPALGLLVALGFEISRNLGVQRSIMY